jgi:hypothetical protein
MNQLIPTLSLFAIVMLTGAAKKPEHSSIDFSSAKLANGEVQLQFKVVPNKGLTVTTDAPWKLEISEVEGLTLASKSFDRTKLDEKLPGFVVSAGKPAAATGKLTYKMISFVCTENKTQCYREVHENTATWK